MFGRTGEKTALHATYQIMMCVYKHSSAVWEYIFRYLVVMSSAQYAYSANPKEEHQSDVLFLFISLRYANDMCHAFGL
jgi:hypothetical protein